MSVFLHDIFDTELFDRRRKDGYINVKHHATYPYSIANYAPKTQIDKQWDEATLASRGLIFHRDTLEVVARPFQKFFNFTESVPPANLLAINPTTIALKADGSLGIIYPRPDGSGYDVATRGSFISDQAQWATAWLNEHMEDFSQPDSATTLCEIIYPDNRIVIDYQGAEKLVCLSAIDHKTGEDICPEWWAGEHVQYFEFDGIDAAKEFMASDETMADEEGFVFMWSQVGQPAFRSKIKQPEYVRLHRILTNTTARDLWEVMRHGGDIVEYLEMVPDEFYQWVKSVTNRLEAKYKALDELRLQEYDAIVTELGENFDRKEFALRVMQTQSKNLLFATQDGHEKAIKKALWKAVYPDHEIPFVNGENDE